MLYVIVLHLILKNVNNVQFKLAFNVLINGNKSQGHVQNVGVKRDLFKLLRRGKVNLIF